MKLPDCGQGTRLLNFCNSRLAIVNNQNQVFLLTDELRIVLKGTMDFRSKSNAKPDIFAASERLIEFYTTHDRTLYRVDLSQSKLRMQAY